ncbi:MAG: EAL domain-containing protein [Candidatus Dormibacteria bacterium]
MGVPNVSRTWYSLGSAGVILAVALRVYLAHPPQGVVATEALLLGVGCLYAAYAVTRHDLIDAAGRRASILTTVVNLALTVSILSVAAPYLPDAMPLTFAVLVVTMLAGILGSADNGALVIRPHVSIGVSGAALGVCWLAYRPLGRGDPQDLVVWGGLLLGTGILIHVHASLGRRSAAIRMERVHAIASMGERLGSAVELPEIARIGLETFKSLYPAVDWGAVLVYDSATDALPALPVWLTPEGVVPADDAMLARQVVIRPGEGLAGTAFQAGRVIASHGQADMRGMSRARPAEQQRQVAELVGDLRSGIAAPLRAGRGEVIGVVSLNSATRAPEWLPADLELVQGLASQLGVALERGYMFEEQRQKAMTDLLTGLPNRRAFERALSDLPNQAPFSVLAIDLDNLKVVNDEYGHEAGDVVLRLVARTLGGGLRLGDTVARVGGDEFAILLPDTDGASAHEIARRMATSMEATSSPYGKASVSIGCATGDAGSGPRETWRLSDEALLRAKATGRARVVALRPGSRRRAQRSPRWGEVLPGLLNERSMEAVFQPILRLSDRSTFGYEALARPTGYGPETSVEGLFATALNMGLAPDLDWLCRRGAVHQARRLPSEAPIFVNVGMPALLDPLHDVDQMLLLLRWAGREPNQVILELSERELVTDLERLRAVLALYREQGFTFAMDDVGEGHSTFAVLAAAQPEYLKVAGSLTRAADEPGPRAAIEGLMAFSNSIRATVIAEGIESIEDDRRMREMGAELGQGFWLARPVTHTEHRAHVVA